MLQFAFIGALLLLEWENPNPFGSLLPRVARRAYHLWRQCQCVGSGFIMDPCYALLE